MVAVDGAGAEVGNYYLKANSLALGVHMANASSRCRRYGLECEYRF